MEGTSKIKISLNGQKKTHRRDKKEIYENNKIEKNLSTKIDIL